MHQEVVERMGVKIENDQIEYWNIKITKDELFHGFIFELIFSFFLNWPGVEISNDQM